MKATSAEMAWAERLWAWAEYHEVAGILKDTYSELVETESITCYDELPFDEPHCPNALLKLPPELGCLKKLNELRYHSLAGKIEIPIEIGLLTNLTVLDFGFSYAQLPRELAQLDSLEYLRFGNGLLADYPKCIWELKALKELTVSSSVVTVLPSEIGNLKKLIALDISGSPIEFLPKEIGLLSSLTYLDLGNTNIKELPREFFSLSQLSFLNLGGSNLEQLPNEIEILDRLSELKLSFTEITRLPETIINLHSLRHLELSEHHEYSCDQEDILAKLKERGCEIMPY